MKKIYTIGSIVLFNNEQGLVVGHHFREIDNKVRLFYFTVPFPQGYIELESLKLVNEELVEEIHSGYKSDDFKFYEEYLHIMKMLTDQLSAEDLAKCFKEADKQLLEEGIYE